MNHTVTRPRLLLAAAALMCLLVVPIAAAGGSGDPQANASGVKKQLVKLKKRVQSLERQVDAVAKQPSPQGSPGEPATKLFAHIDDDAGEDAAIAYGSGVVDVSDDPGDSGGSYIVRFSRSLVGCVAHATPGTGVPFVFSGAITSGAGVTPTVSVGINDGQDVRVTFVRDGGIANPDSAFMISAFC